MDPFVAILLVGLAAVAIWVWLLGKYSPGSGLEQLGLRDARQITQAREELEAEDLGQMLAAHNARRRARGEREVTAGDIEMRVASDQRDQRQRREALAAERDLDGLLEASNARRRARGLPERTREQAEQEFGSRPDAGR